ncbi:SpoIIE family protein phosphatase [Luteolibacter flavescens]|uniref:SpoIIE family protein phosphatase n=1 Tax=Luteolibacter flavescens TaxID=1859460 RepID=A0ABT3FJ59_9BACT|nr:SpoIIE family protein phosphatase [Luteolibacter flavescens]MCW1883603.1 SpoIIE family protein phosphatase [Luteolibacter flavescens]
MRLPPLGLRAKIALALAIAALLPLVVGLIALETFGFGHLLATKGRLYESEARALSRSLEMAVESQSGHFWSWIAADPALPDFLSIPRPSLSPEETAAVEKQWPKLSADDPLLREILGNPASLSLSRYAASHPQAAEILVTDTAGRVVAATRKTTDYDQADEEWWTIGRSLREGGMWAEVLHFDASADVFSLDLVLPLHRDHEFLGVAKLVLDVSPLFLGLHAPDDDEQARLEILLPDGHILARTNDKGFESLKEKLEPDALLSMRVGRTGWTLTGKGTIDERMTGFAAIQSPEIDRKLFEPGGYVLYSSPKNAVVAPLRRQVMLIGLAAGLATGACVLAGYALVDRKILQPVAMLSQATRALAETVNLRRDPTLSESEVDSRRRAAKEDLERIESIKTGDEVEELAADFGIMTSRVMRYHRELESEVDAKTALLREELEMAREFQNALLPSGYPDTTLRTDPLRLGFAHFYQPASTVGGDFFDLMELDEHRTGVLIADVMGHGARSALVTAILRAVVRNHVISAGNPGDFLGILNRELHEVIERSQQTLFVTAFFMVLDTREAKVTWAVAGHPAPLRARRSTGNPPQALWSGALKQPALGLVADMVYHTSTSAIRAGDVFLLFTDGVVEAENPGGKEFGMPRLISTFDESLDGPLAAMPAKIVCEVAAYQKRRHHDDDVCVVAVEVLPGVVQEAPARTASLTGSVPSGA